ncbi:exo-alpha-sialidase, partial [bacterium]|nr:exo-alpha-sialidase [bacterium]
MNAPIVLQLDPSVRNSRNSEGAFITLRSGRIVFAYTKYGPHSHDDSGALIAARYSDDGGRTWSTRDRILVRQEG